MVRGKGDGEGGGGTKSQVDGDTTVITLCYDKRDAASPLFVLV